MEHLPVLSQVRYMSLKERVLRVIAGLIALFAGCMGGMGVAAMAGHLAVVALAQHVSRVGPFVLVGGLGIAAAVYGIGPMTLAINRGLLRCMGGLKPLSSPTN